VQCSAVQCSAVQCSAVQCSAVQCSAVQCSAVQCSAVQCAPQGVQKDLIWPSLAPRSRPGHSLQCSAVQCSAHCALCSRLFLDYVVTLFDLLQTTKPQNVCLEQNKIGTHVNKLSTRAVRTQHMGGHVLGRCVPVYSGRGGGSQSAARVRLGARSENREGRGAGSEGSEGA
jgi:hypothetical protein